MAQPHSLGTLVSILLAALATSSYGQGVPSQSATPATAGNSAVSAPPQAAAPVTMTECEGINNCATWTFLGTQGNGQWPSGEVANLSVEHLDADSVAIRRADSTGPSAGLTAVYKGTRHEDRVGGEFTSSWPGHWDNKSGNWYATIGKISQSLPSVMRVCAIGAPRPGWPLCGTWTWNNGHYDAAWPEIGVTATVTVASFTPESVIFNRADYGKEAGKWVYTGKISTQGDSILNGDVLDTNNALLGHYNATWGAATQDTPAVQPVQPVVVRPVVCWGWWWVVCE